MLPRSIADAGSLSLPYLPAVAHTYCHSAVIDKRVSAEERRLYPINTLRNVALDASSTDLVLLVDVNRFFSSRVLTIDASQVDFVPSAGLHGELVRDEHLSHSALTKKHVFVVPAFEVSERS